MLVNRGRIGSKCEAIVIDVGILDIDAEVDVGVVLIIIISVAETCKSSNGCQCWYVIILEFDESLVATPVVVEVRAVIVEG